MSKKGLIYQVSCEKNGQNYIGKTRSTVQQRWYNHCLEARRGSQRDLHIAIREHGQDAFRWEVLQAWDSISNEDLRVAENHWIHNNEAFDNGYNMVVKGRGAAKDGLTLSPVTENTKELISASVSDNTLRAYHRCLEDLTLWLGEKTLDDATLADYLTSLFEAGQSPSTCSQVVAAVRWRSKYANTNDLPLTLTDSTLAGIRRQGKDRGRGQVDGLTWKQVERVCIFAEQTGTLAGMRDSVMIRLMSDCLLRVSEVVAIDCGDLQETTLEVKQSKTDQEGEGEALYICESTREVLSRYLSKGEISQGAVFRQIRRGDKIQSDRLTDRSARRIIQKRATDAGVSGFISGHSLRVGSAVSLAQAGASVVDMQVAGRWKSAQMPAHYAKAELAERGAIARFKDGK